MNIPQELRYARTHEWVRLEGSNAQVGITDYAQNSLGDIVYVEIPESGRAVSAGDEAATVESVKAASAIYTPLSGTVSGGNADLEAHPELLNQDPYGTPIFTLSVSDPAEVNGLMDAEAYRRFLAEEQQKH